MAQTTNIAFEKAKETDIKGMAEIEKLFFGSYGRAFDEESLTKWFLHNPDMFYVVKDELDELQAFAIVAPVTEGLYQKLRTGQESDMYDFKEEDVVKTFESKYFYLADICIKDQENISQYLKVATVLIGEMMKLMYVNAKYVLATPVTEKGLKISKTIGFVPVATDIVDGQEYPVCEIVVTEEKYQKYKGLIDRSSQMSRP